MSVSSLPQKKYQEHQNETEYGTYTIGRLLINEILERLHKKLEKTGAFFDIGGQYMDSLDHILLVRENIDELWLASHEDLKECQEFTQLYRTQIKNDVKNIFSTIVLYQKYLFF